MLQDKVLRLEQMLAERDLKIEQLGGQLKAAPPATSAQPSAPNQDAAGGPREIEGRNPSNSAFDGMSDLKLEFQGQIMKLQQYIEANNLRHVDPLGVPPPPPLPVTLHPLLSPLMLLSLLLLLRLSAVHNTSTHNGKHIAGLHSQAVASSMTTNTGCTSPNSVALKL